MTEAGNHLQVHQTSPPAVLIPAEDELFYPR